jgi:hypothetical protein
MGVTPAQLIELLRAGTAPPKVRSAIANNLLPLPPATLIEALDLLGDDPDDAIASQAAQTLAQLPPTIVRGVASAPAASPALLDRIARRFPSSAEVALDLARNAATADRTIAYLATLAHPAVLEVIGKNQARLERAPEIVAQLFANEATPTNVVLLWQEHQQRGAGAAPVAHAAPAEDEEEIPPEFHADLIADEDEVAPARLVPEAEEGALTAKQLSVYQLVKKMSMGQKVALAMKGNGEVRNLLVHESNKMLCLKVLDNPRLGDSEIEAWAKATNISEDVLRAIANRKEWVKKYAIMKGLTCNPKTPLGITLDFVKRLTKKDLEQLARNRNVPETLRNTARRLFVLKRDSNTG